MMYQLYQAQADLLFPLRQVRPVRRQPGASWPIVVPARRR